MGNLVRRASTVVAVAGLALVGWATPAAAHVEVEADNARAGATDVTISFIAESESARAGIVSLEVALPDGITINDVTYVSGPAGWALTPSSIGYLVAGPALGTGVDAAYKIRVRQLPTDAGTLTFKTLQTYSDGRIDRWIEIPTAAVPKPDMPAPVLQVSGALPASPSVSTPSVPASSVPTQPAATATATAAEALSSSEPAAAPAESRSSTGWLITAVIVVLSSTGIYWLLQRRRRSSPAS